MLTVKHQEWRERPERVVQWRVRKALAAALGAKLVDLYTSDGRVK